MVSWCFIHNLWVNCEVRKSRSVKGGSTKHVRPVDPPTWVNCNDSLAEPEKLGHFGITHLIDHHYRGRTARWLIANNLIIYLDFRNTQNDDMCRPTWLDCIAILVDGHQSVNRDLYINCKGSHYEMDDHSFFRGDFDHIWSTAVSSCVYPQTAPGISWSDGRDFTLLKLENWPLNSVLLPSETLESRKKHPRGRRRSLPLLGRVYASRTGDM